MARERQGMQLVTFWMTRADADALITTANSLGWSRSELLRRASRELIENNTDGEQ